MLTDDLKRLIRPDLRITALTGAGISSESGIPVFRGPEGLWKNCRPEELASPAAFAENPDRVWEWYQYRRGIVRNAQPNAGHRALADLQKLFPQFKLITQNVDALHERAGSEGVLELHGNIEKNYCSICGKRYDRRFPLEMIKVPRCDCGGAVRPDIVWFGEMLNTETWQHAAEAASDAELFLCIGTSSIVYPAASLPWTALDRGAAVVEINPEITDLSSRARLHIQEKSAAALTSLLEEIRQILFNAEIQK